MFTLTNTSEHSAYVPVHLASCSSPQTLKKHKQGERGTCLWEGQGAEGCLTQQWVPTAESQGDCGGCGQQSLTLSLWNGHTLGTSGSADGTPSFLSSSIPNMARRVGLKRVNFHGPFQSLNGRIRSLKQEMLTPEQGTVTEGPNSVLPYCTSIATTHRTAGGGRDPYRPSSLC